MSRVNPCAIEGSLVRLCLERVDIFHLHNAITETGGGGGSAQRPTGARRCGAGVRAGRIVFGTTADGGTIPTERLRIDNAGRV
jgi:hypothetical protein